MVEHHVANVIVAGSIPVTRSIFRDGVSDFRAGASVAQLVEHHVANVIVAGSIPVTRSIFLLFFDFFLHFSGIPVEKLCRGVYCTA